MKAIALAGVAGMAMTAVLAATHVAGCATNESTAPDKALRSDEFYARLPVPDFATGGELAYVAHVDSTLYADDLVIADIGVGVAEAEVATNRYTLTLKLSHMVLDDYTIEHPATSARFTVRQTAEQQDYVFEIGGATHRIRGAQHLLTDAVQSIPREHRDEFAVMIALTGVASKIDRRMSSEPEPREMRCEDRVALVDGVEVVVAEEGCCELEAEPAAVPFDGTTPSPSWLRRAGKKLRSVGGAVACVAAYCTVDQIRGTECRNGDCYTIWCAPWNCPNQCPNGNPDCRP